MIIRSKAPLRISFGGGGTDISPYPEERGGVALNVTIDKYAFCTLIPRGDGLIKAKSLDYDTEIRYGNKEDLVYNGKLDLVKAAIKVMKPDSGLDLFLHSDAPPGTGLGSSSTVTVALVGALMHHMKLPLTDYEIAESAYLIERNEVGIKGGKQDQYAATFGGFNFIEFLKDKVIVNPLRIKQDILNELEYRLLLCYTGGTRLSAGIIEDQVTRYVEGRSESVEALDKTKKLAIAMKNALLLGDVDRFGHLLGEAWEAKKNFSPKITSPQIDRMYEVAMKYGALGGKLSGAGGGGYLSLLCEFNRKHVVAEEVKKVGGEPISAAFESRGLQTWEVNH